MKYSWLLSVYKNSKLNEVKQCLDSLNAQTEPADQCVIVFDGEVPNDLSEYLDNLANEQFKYYTLVKLPKNVGTGAAVNAGMPCCRNEIIARMDMDDIAVTTRMEKQLARMELDPELSAIGGNIVEFIDDITNVVGCRKMPTTHEELCEYLKSRSPFNNMTVTLRKSHVEKAGGYQHWHYAEDMYLFIRMYLAGCKFANLDETLAYARVGEDMYKRRGGIKYYRSEKQLFKFMYKNKVINFMQYQKAKTIRCVVHVLMPNSMRQWFYTKFARKNK